MSEIDRTRTCGQCGVRDIPYGVDWPYWLNGRPVHALCALTEGARRYDNGTLLTNPLNLGPPKKVD